MATLDRQIPSPDTFLCEPWSSFVSAAKLRFVDCKNMHLFPALEDFSLVVCHVCSKVVTPQGILTHYGKPHTYTNPLSPLPLTPAHSENLHLYFRFFSCHPSLYFYSLLLCQCKQTQLSSENLYFLIISWLLPQDESRAYQQPLGLSALP
uniref:Ataxin 7 like 1 n=1 Tax=Haplochromis burtoni TaxID=8153 RepID=A0A3Q2X2S3_HAPBU